MGKEILNLGEKIYLLTYSEARYYNDISKILYGKKDCKQILHEIKNLDEKDWIKPVPLKSVLKEKSVLTDGRAMRRKYYRANSQPLYDVIVQRLKKSNTDLNKNEEEKLKSFLEKTFRKNVNQFLSYADIKDPSFGISTVLEELSWQCEFNVLLDSYLKKMYNRMVGSRIVIKNFTQWKKERLREHLSKTDSNSNTLSPEENVEKSLGKSLMEKLTYLSYKSIASRSRIWAGFLKVNEELLFLYEYKKEKGELKEYKKDKEDIVKFNIRSHFLNLYDSVK